MRVHLGSWQRNLLDKGEVAVSVKELCVHQNYTGYENDIAVLTLAHPINFTDTIRPACLPESEEHFPTETEAFTTGWTVRQAKEKHRRRRMLQELKVILMHEQHCANYFDISLPENVLCASHIYGSLCEANHVHPRTGSNMRTGRQRCTRYAGHRRALVCPGSALRRSAELRRHHASYGVHAGLQLRGELHTPLPSCQNLQSKSSSVHAHVTQEKFKRHCTCRPMKVSMWPGTNGSVQDCLLLTCQSSLSHHRKHFLRFQPLCSVFSGATSARLRYLDIGVTCGILNFLI